MVPSNHARSCLSTVFVVVRQAEQRSHFTAVLRSHFKSRHDAQYLNAKKRSHHSFFADIATQIIFHANYCLTFIQDTLHSAGLARNPFLQGDISEYRNED